jgi:hypothetical protein
MDTGNSEYNLLESPKSSLDVVDGEILDCIEVAL